MTSPNRPHPEDPDFFTRFTLGEDIREAAFGPDGGTPLPRITARAGGGAGPGDDLGYNDPVDQEECTRPGRGVRARKPGSV